MRTWVEDFHFVKDPYEKLDPYKIDPRYLVWDRPDLANARADIDRLIQDISDGRRTGLKAFGSSGSGKTWLTRVIEIEIHDKIPEVLFLYTKVPKMEPTYRVVYRIAIQNLLDGYFVHIKEYLKKARNSETGEQAWKALFEPEDLARAFANYCAGTHTALVRKWFVGDKVSASQLEKLGLTSSLSSDYDRFEMLVQILKQMKPVFPTTVLVIDELENASVKLAGQLSDGLRDMLDSFSENFVLLASFTAQKDEEWYDLGYSEALFRRLDYTVNLEALSPDSVADFLRIHHRAYREANAAVKDQLHPFAEEGAVTLLESITPGHHYPGYYLPDCRNLATICKGRSISSDFVKKNLGRLAFK
jgi:hypothetical protein